MIVVRFLFSYMFVLAAVESLLLIGGWRSDRDFFLGVLVALAVTLIWRLAPKLKIAAAHPELKAQVSPQPRRQAPRGPARPLHGPSPSH